MAEKRKYDRIHLIHFLRLFDRKTGELIGNLVDLTDEGLQLICENVIEPGKLLEIRMEFPELVDGEKEVMLNAEAVWCDHQRDPDLYSVGCK
ncbi:MAG TPA: PilZ domain-containing protein, partial [Leptolinea sp.]